MAAAAEGPSLRDCLHQVRQGPTEGFEERVERYLRSVVDRETRRLQIVALYLLSIGHEARIEPGIQERFRVLQRVVDRLLEPLDRNRVVGELLRNAVWIQEGVLPGDATYREKVHSYYGFELEWYRGLSSEDQQEALRNAGDLGLLKDVLG